MSAEETTPVTYRMAKGASIFFAGVFFGKVVFLGMQVLLGRLLGPAGYGLYSLGFSMVMVVQWVASLGLDWGVLRYCALYRGAARPEQVKGTLRAGLGLSLLSSLVTACLLGLASNWLATRFFAVPELGGVLRLFALALPFYVLMRITSTFAQSQQEIYRMTMIQHVAQPALNMLFVAGVFLLGFDLLGAVASFLLSVALSAALGFRYLRQVFPAFVSALPARYELGGLLRYSLALTLIGVSYQIVLRTANLLLGYLADARAVGLYSAGASLAMVLALVPGIFAQPVLPLMVELFEAQKREELKRVYRTLTRWTFSAVLPLFLLLCLFRHEIMGLFGQEFRAGSSILIPLSLAWLVYFAKGPAAGLLDMTGRQNLDLVNMLAVGTLNVALNFLLIPRYGPLGAALAMAAAIMVWAGLEYVEVRLFFGIVPWSANFVHQLVVAVVAAVIGLLLEPHLPWVLAAAVTVGSYGLLFFGFCLVDEDRELLRLGFARLREWLARPSAAQEGS